MPSPASVRNANPLWRRLIRRWRQWRGAELGKTHQVHLVEVDGRTFKRVRFADRTEADAVSDALQALAGLNRFPALIRQEGCEVWTDFVPGSLAQKRSPDHRARVVEFFVDLYQMPAQARPPDTRALAGDLDFLVEAGLLARSDRDRLAGRAEQLMPELVLSGYDYIDPLLKNFVIADNRAIGIDIEAVLASQHLGSGLAKARLRWMGDDYQKVLSELDRPDGADLTGQYPWVELCFLASYFRQKILQGKRGHIQIEALLRYAS